MFPTPDLAVSKTTTGYNIDKFHGMTYDFGNDL